MRASPHGIRALQEAPERLPAPSTAVSEKSVTWKRAFPGPCWHPETGLSTSRTVRNKFLWRISYPVCGILLWQPTWTKIVGLSNTQWVAFLFTIHSRLHPFVLLSREKHGPLPNSTVSEIPWKCRVWTLLLIQDLGKNINHSGSRGGIQYKIKQKTRRFTGIPAKPSCSYFCIQ